MDDRGVEWAVCRQVIKLAVYAEGPDVDDAAQHQGPAHFTMLRAELRTLSEVHRAGGQGSCLTCSLKAWRTAREELWERARSRSACRTPHSRRFFRQR
jgi:hypothetical protein